MLPCRLGVHGSDRQPIFVGLITGCMTDTAEKIRQLAPHWGVMFVVMFVVLAIVERVVGSLSFLASMLLVFVVAFRVSDRRSGSRCCAAYLAATLVAGFSGLQAGSSGRDHSSVESRNGAAIRRPYVVETTPSTNEMTAAAAIHRVFGCSSPGEAVSPCLPVRSVRIKRFASVPTPLRARRSRPLSVNRMF